MSLKAIKISEENYVWLVGLSSEFQKELGRPVSLDGALRLIHRGKLIELAGAWKMSQAEADAFSKRTRQGLKKWKISV